MPEERIRLNPRVDPVWDGAHLLFMPGPGRTEAKAAHLCVLSLVSGHYSETVQERCLRLIPKRLLVSLAMEGRFTTDGLHSLSDGGHILMEMARELVTERGIEETADQA